MQTVSAHADECTLLVALCLLPSILLVMAECIFCKIVAGEAPAHKIWEDAEHLAFLTPFPNTEGFTVVITKDHHPSYVADLNSETRSKLIDAACAVAKKLDAAFTDVGRTGVMFEGFGVDHIHAKLFPMHGTNSDEWKKRSSHEEKYFEQYEGYISSHDAARTEEDALKKVAEKIRKVI